MGAPVQSVRARESPAVFVCAWCRRPFLRPPPVATPTAILCGGCLPAALRAAEDALLRLDRQRAERSRRRAAAAAPARPAVWV